MMRILAASLVVILGSFGCSSSSDDTPPTLEITSPQRGTLASGSTVNVTGRVTDNGPVKLTVAGQPVTPNKDGTFMTTVQVGEGIQLIETHAIDGGGNDVRDVRAVLAGKLGPSDGSSPGQIGARAGVSALNAVAGKVGEAANNIDFNAIAKAANPVYDNGGCLGAQINITSVTHGTVSVALTPKADILSADVAIPNVVIKLSASFKVACIGGSTTITVKASKAKVHGDLAARIASGKVVTSLPGASVSFDNFSIDVGGVPGAIDSLLKGEAQKAATNAMTDAIKSKVPGIANTAIAGLVAKPVNASLLGKDMTISIDPATVKITPDELFVGLDTSVRVVGGEGGTFLTTDATLASMTSTPPHGLGIAVDDDIINQLFAGLWGADVFEMNLSIDAIPALGLLLDDDARSVAVKLSLPPTVSTDTGELVLALGDMMVSVRDENQAEIQSMATSLTTSLAAQPSQSGNILLTVGSPTVYAQVLGNADVVQRPLTDEQVEGLVKAVWGLVGSKADDALSKLPMPTIAGITLGAPKVDVTTGFLLADIPVM